MSPRQKSPAARYALATDPGRVRENNEDCAQAVPELGLFVVADGMGGHIAGEIASRLATETLIEAVRARRRPRRIMDEAPLLGEALLAAHLAVMREAKQRELHGMGTTLTALMVRGRTATIAHIGDSRACLVHKHQMIPLTQDHTLVALLVESGAIPADEAKDHPERHVLTQAIGPPTELDPDITQARIPRGARILLSSDGLHDVVGADEILELAEIVDVDEAVKRMVERANALGGPDNITALLVHP